MGVFGGIFGADVLSIGSGGPPFLFSTGTPNTGGTAVWPAHQVGDTALLLIETQGVTAPSFSDAAGFVVASALYSSTPQTAFGMYWCRATSSSMTAPAFTGGDHIIAQIFVFRDCRSIGDPFDAVALRNAAHSGSLMDLPSLTSLANGSLIVSAIATIDDTIGSSLITTNFRDYQFSNLGVVEIGDVRTAEGLGGGFGVCAGNMDTAGPTGAGTCVHTNASNFAATEAFNIAITIALAPAPITSSDDTPPEIVVISPATQISADSVITLEVTDNNSMAVAAILAVITDATTGVLLFDEPVHDGQVFRHFYQGGSNTRTAIEGGYRFTIRRDGGWPGNVKFDYIPFDRFGNEGVVV